MKRASLALAVGFVASCNASTVVEPPPGEIILYVDTDAPVPPATNARPRLDQPTPLFDRLRIEIFAPGAVIPCDGCVNEFAIDSERFAERRASIGVALPPGVTGFRAHVVMYLAAHRTGDGSLEPTATLDTTALLPSVDERGKTDVTVMLSTEDVGVPVGTLDEPVAVTPGAPTTSSVGTWPDAKRIDCGAPPPAGQVCVPGGAFWIGGYRGSWTFIPLHDTLRPRLTVIAPYYLDATEVTVAQLRARPLGDITPWSGSSRGDAIEDFCTYTEAPDPHDDQPANCIVWASARAFCQAKGGDLPTEAQYEYAASGLVGSTYVWGEDLPTCGDAVYSRTGYGLFAGSVAYCKQASPPGGAGAVATSARDRLALPTGTIFDLAGNVAEWTLDRWNRSTEACWSGGGVLRDPLCQSASFVDGGLRTGRGGDWLVTGQQLARTIRFGAEALRFYSPELGFRCATPADPAP